MKIETIHTHVLQSQLDQPFAFSQGWVHKRSATLVEIVTDDGIVGWGEAFAQGLEAPQIAAAAIKHSLTPLLIGQDPRDTERLWYKMYNQTRDFGRTGSVLAAISAVDIALWDIAGKAQNKPIYQLLGGAFRHELEPYATGFYRINGQGEADRLAEEALMHYENGFRHMKIKLGFGLQDDIQVMQAINKALQGKQAVLMVDSNHAYGYAEALELGMAMVDFGLRWYEEPLAPEDVSGYQRLRQQLPIAIAGGENCHSLYGFREWFCQNALAIAQPDVGSCGGITSMRHIATLAQAFGVEINPHVWGSSVVQAAALQVMAALPDTNHSLFSRAPILEYDQSSHPFRTHLTKTPITMHKQRIKIPDGPGLGIQIARDIVDRYRINSL